MDDKLLTNEQLNRLIDTDVGLVAKFSDDNYEMLKAYKNAAVPGRRLVIEQPGAWPEFLFAGTVITLEIDGDRGRWRIEEVSMLGITLSRVD